MTGEVLLRAALVLGETAVEALLGALEKGVKRRVVATLLALAFLAEEAAAGRDGWKLLESRCLAWVAGAAGSTSSAEAARTMLATVRASVVAETA